MSIFFAAIKNFLLYYIFYTNRKTSMDYALFGIFYE